jgi:hypothetical protein
MDGHAQQQAERIDDDMTFPTLDLFARIEALGSSRAPLFCAPLAL